MKPIVEVTFTRRLRWEVPATISMPLRITNASPIDTSSSGSMPARLARIGRHISSSSPTPTAAVVAIANSTATISGSPSVTLITNAM